jgi:hypothetical protein
MHPGAQPGSGGRGGVGLSPTSRKEGRALGEVTKFLVYNARKRQVGGDTADQYFARTECVAGVQDMRFQELMPDVLHWLGVRKIHRLVSMSNMKYDAITKSGIEVGERVNIPDELIPGRRPVEMDAKMAAGYFTPGAVPDAERSSRPRAGGWMTAGRIRAGPLPAGDLAAAALRTTHAVRERCGQCSTGPARPLGLVHASTTASCATPPPKWPTPPAAATPSCTSRSTAAGATSRPAASTARPNSRSCWATCGAGARPRHGRPHRRQRAARCRRRRRLEVRRAGTGQTFTRSEGLGVASFHAFTAGMFSSDKLRPAAGRCRRACAVWSPTTSPSLPGHENNPLVGLDGRAVLLRRLGEVMADQPEVFGTNGRPAGIFDLMVADEGGIAHTADVDAHDILSQILLSSLSAIWPLGHSIGGVPLGDVWRHDAVRGEGPSDGWVPFHKLSQWLTYSLLEPFHWSGVKVRGLDKLTGLPEYRNGGLLLDTGVLQLRDPKPARTVWHPGDEIIVEWRALTVSLLDELAHGVRERAVDVRRQDAPGLRARRRHLGGGPRTRAAHPRRIAAAAGACDGTVF